MRGRANASTRGVRIGWALCLCVVGCGTSGSSTPGSGGSSNAGSAGMGANGGIAASGGDAAMGGADASGGASGTSSGIAGTGVVEAAGSGPDYVEQPGKCGFDKPAFCETFEDGPKAGGRAGELEPRAWSVVRGMPYNSSSFDDAFRIGPALIGDCRADVSNTRVLPDADVLVCDPVSSIPSRHALATAAAQNYGLTTYRIRRPFDFSAGTGSIKLDLDLTNSALGGWPALIIAEDPTPAPSFDWEERGSGPKNGVEIEFHTGWCNTPHTVEVSVYAFHDYLQTQYVPPFDCGIPHAVTAPDSLNHVELRVSRGQLEVWASDVSSDGVTFPNLHLLYGGNAELSFTRGYVSLALRNHATIKYWLGSAAALRFDNVGFDGPIVDNYREYSAPDALTSFSGLSGCSMGDAECKWVGDVIPAYPDDTGRTTCAASGCTYEAEGRNVGYVVPNVDEEAPPTALDFSGVDPSGATRARLAIAAIYPAFDWNGVSHPPTYLALRLRINGGAWHERNITESEANAFVDFSPELGGAGAGSGLLNQIVDLDVAELVAGDNRIEVEAENTWTGTYRVMLTGADLVLDWP